MYPSNFRHPSQFRRIFKGVILGYCFDNPTAVASQVITTSTSISSSSRKVWRHLLLEELVIFLITLSFRLSSTLHPLLVSFSPSPPQLSFHPLFFFIQVKKWGYHIHSSIILVSHYKVYYPPQFNLLSNSRCWMKHVSHLELVSLSNLTMVRDLLSLTKLFLPFISISMFQLHCLLQSTLDMAGYILHCKLLTPVRRRVFIIFNAINTLRHAGCLLFSM